MATEGFSERRGARKEDDEITRVCIVITDGRSQDNVTEPAVNARKQRINMFTVGVTDHILESELEAIAGSPARWFHVDKFKDLDTRLRSLIQKAACPSLEPKQLPPTGCNPTTQTGCDRALNEICTGVFCFSFLSNFQKKIKKKKTLRIDNFEIFFFLQINGTAKCMCPEGFQRHPSTRRCGGSQCNPDLPTSCPHPEICMISPFSNSFCVCPKGYQRNQRFGICSKLLIDFFFF